MALRKVALNSAVSTTNLTAIESSLTYMKLGPFDNHVEACKACYAGHTKASVVKNCICTAFTADDGPTLFCTASAAGVGWSSTNQTELKMEFGGCYPIFFGGGAAAMAVAAAAAAGGQQSHQA